MLEGQKSEPRDPHVLLGAEGKDLEELIHELIEVRTPHRALHGFVCAILKMFLGHVHDFLFSKINWIIGTRRVLGSRTLGTEATGGAGATTGTGSTITGI
jgi:hypothetical protein